MEAKAAALLAGAFHDEEDAEDWRSLRYWLSPVILPDEPGPSAAREGAPYPCG